MILIRDDNVIPRSQSGRKALAKTYVFCEVEGPKCTSSGLALKVAGIAQLCP